MSEQTILSEKQQLALELEKRDAQNTDLESQIADSSPPARPVFLLLWLLFVIGTIATIVSSNWITPEVLIRSGNTLLNPTSISATSTPLPTSAPTSTCDNLTLRREWRNMKRREQARYQTAMRCLLELPSKNGKTGSRLGDFLSAYSTSGWHATQTTDYLPWNRFFMHTLETALRSECGYRGDMPYLDWTVATAKADSTDASAPAVSYSQASLRDEAAKQHLDAALVSEIVSAANYNDFAHVLESRITSLAPFDFSSPELPQDPLFLHQMQVDRLWWVWQQQHPKTEMRVEDQRVRISGFGKSIAVKSVASTEGYDLCYRYV
ncbi:Di-copper centre-containing protein [Aureobasidium subglaciale]|nr:Di-copper centre-containing protein [Aureobasidium subglaciale]